MTSRALAFSGLRENAHHGQTAAQCDKSNAWTITIPTPVTMRMETAKYVAIPPTRI
jgi:hypothetical protein